MNLDQLLSLQFEQPSMKRQKGFGLKLAKEMWTFVSSGPNSYYAVRDKNWEEVQLWSKGAITDQDFKDLMGVDGNDSWINIDWNIIKLVPSFVNRITQIFMDRSEKPSVRATDVGSASYKEREKVISRFRMEQQAKIRQMQQVSGMKLEGEGFVPEDEDQLDVYYKIEFRMPEEAFFEEEIWKVFENSDIEYLKREWTRDLLKNNFAICKQEASTGNMKSSPTLSNRLRVRRADPKNTVYNIFKNANGSDISLIGEAYPLKVSDARRMFPNVSEKEWFEMAQFAQKGGVQRRPLDWNEGWINAFTKPYDDWSWIVFDFEVKVYDKEYYVQWGDEYNGGIDLKKGFPRPNPESGAQVIDLGKFNMYHGVWIVGSEYMLSWDIEPNQIRPFQNGVDVFGNYSVVCPHADGFYVPSLVERGIPCVRQMVLCALKIQQMISLMEPDGMAVDVAGLREVNLGLGKSYEPLQLMKIKQQTGRTYWDSTDTSGVGGPGNPIPFQNMPYGGNVAQINTLIQVFNWWLERLNEEWGVSKEIMAQPTSAKKSAAATNMAGKAGSLAVEYIYDHLVMLMEQAAIKIGYTLWDYIVFDSGKYKEWSGISRDLIDATFDINVDMSDKAAERERLTGLVNLALEAKIIGLATAARLMDIPNPKSAVLYLEKMEKRAKKEARENQQRQIQMNAQVQQQSTEIATEGKIKIEQVKGQVKALLESLKGNEDSYKEMVRFIGEMEKESLRSGKEFPRELSAVKDAIMQGVVQRKEESEENKQN